MKLKIKIFSTIFICITLLAVICCSYNFLYLYKSSIAKEFNTQKYYSEIVSNAVTLNFKENTKKFDDITSFISLTQVEALEKFHQFYKKQDLLDFSTFPYFAISNASNQLFEVNELPEGKSCQGIFNIPEDKTVTFKKELSEKKVVEENLWCTIDREQAFLGYRILNIADKNFIYIQKIDKKYLFKEKNIEERIKDFDLNSLLYTHEFEANSKSTAVILMSDKGKILKSNLDKNAAVSYSDSILKSDFEKAIKDKAPVQIELENTKDGKAKLVTISYLPELKVFSVIANNKGHVIKKEIISIFLIAALAIAVLTLLILMAKQVLTKVTKELNSVQNNVDVLKTLVLEPKEKMEEAITKIDTSKFSLTKLGSLYASISNFAKEVTVSVEQKTEELTKIGENNVKEAIENKELSMLTSFHKQMASASSDMPNSKFLDIASFIVPSKTEPKAFYDIFRVDKDNIGIVFGKTTESSLKAVSAINLVTSFVKDALTTKSQLPSQALTDVNHILLQKDLGDLNITCFVMILSEFTGNFIYSMAGLCLPTLIHLHKEQKLEAKAIHAELCANKDEVYVDSKGKFTFLDSLIFVNKDIHDVKDENNNDFDELKVTEVFIEKADDEASNQLIAFYRELKKHAGSEFENLNKDVSAIVIKKNANNKEFD